MPKSFEEKITELENIVNQFKEKAVGLQDSLKSYQEGLKLVADCQKELTKFEEKLETLNENTSKRQDLDKSQITDKP